MLRILLLLLFSFALEAKIIETRRLEEVLAHVDEQTWVLLGLDDTLIEGQNQYGRSAWFESETQKMMRGGLSNYEAQKIFYPQWILSQSFCPCQTPESKTANVVANIQASAGWVMGFTTRHPSIAKVTVEQLKKLGIDLSCQAPVFPDALPKTLYPTLFQNGIWYVTDFNPLGKSFVLLLDSLQEAPKRIVYVDADRRRLDTLEKALSKRNAAFVGIHYTQAIEKPFDAEIAELQYQSFPKVLTDLDASQKLEKTSMIGK